MEVEPDPADVGRALADGVGAGVGDRGLGHAALDEEAAVGVGGLAAGEGEDAADSVSRGTWARVDSPFAGAFIFGETGAIPGASLAAVVRELNDLKHGEQLCSSVAVVILLCRLWFAYNRQYKRHKYNNSE
jgi:hypothetical protein